MCSLEFLIKGRLEGSKLVEKHSHISSCVKILDTGPENGSRTGIYL